MTRPTTPVVTRILDLMRGKNISQAKLSKILNLSRSHVNHWFKGRSEPTNAHLAQIAQILDSTPEYLAFGESNEPLPLSSKDIKLLPILELAEIDDWLREPILTNYKRRIPVAISEILVGNSPSKDLDAGFWVQVKGDSMTAPIYDRDSLYEGEFVLFDPTTQAKPGSVVLAQVENNKIIRRFSYDGQMPVLEAFNPRYPVIYVNDKVKIIGQKCGVFRN